MFSIVLFDIGDVLATFDPASRMEEYARRSGLSPVEVRQRLAREDFWVNTDRGLYSGDEMHRELSARLEHRFSREEVVALQAAAFTIRPEIVAMARSVTEVTRVGILTNNAPLLEEAFPVHFPELMRIFDPILYSYRFGHAKPEPGLFEAVREFLGVAPNEIFFIDDQARHVAAAKAAGWHAVRFESAAQLRQVLADRGLLQRSE